MSDAWVQPFLTALRLRGKIAPACRVVGVSSTKVYALRKADADFSAAIDEAIDECIDDMEAEMIRRAKDGVNKPVIHQGTLQYLTEPVTDDDGNVVLDKSGHIVQRLVYDEDGKPMPLTVNERSDTLLMFGLKGYRKGQFAERTELTGAGGKDLETLSPVERTSRIAAIMAEAQRRADEDIG